MSRKLVLMIIGCISMLVSSQVLRAQWITQPTNTTQNLRSLTMLSATEGWAVGAGSTLLNTTDGKTWQAMSSGIAGNYTSITFNDLTGVQGWIVGDMPKVINTIDGGLSWTSVPSGTTNTLNSVQFLSQLPLGWAVGNAGTIIGSTDGGATWNKEISGVTTNLNQVVFLGNDLTSIGFAVGDKGVLLTTIDNGANWVKRPLNTDKNLNAIDMFDPNNGWIVGDQTILHTTDGGATWVSQSYPNPTILHTVTIIDTATAYAAGNGGRIVKTLDGKTWSDVASGSTQSLYSLQDQGSALSLWVAGDHGTILFSGTPASVASGALQPTANMLAQNYPNPFNPSTTIRYRLGRATTVNLVIYDQLGRKVATLVSGDQNAGEHSVVWNGEMGGISANSGIYFCRLMAGGVSLTSKMTLAK